MTQPAVKVGYALTGYTLPWGGKHTVARTRPIAQDTQYRWLRTAEEGLSMRPGSREHKAGWRPAGVRGSLLVAAILNIVRSTLPVVVADKLTALRSPSTATALAPATPTSKSAPCSIVCRQQPYKSHLGYKCGTVVQSAWPGNRGACRR